MVGRVLVWLMLMLGFIGLTIDVEPLSLAHAQTAATQCDSICTISWVPPTQRTDGTAFDESEIDYYSWYCNGEHLLDLDAVMGTWQAEIVFTTPGTYECALTVVDLGGRESEQSNTKSFIKGVAKPMAPQLL